MREYRNFVDLQREFLNNPENAKVYLQTALEDYKTDGDTVALMQAMRDVIEAQGGIAPLAKRLNMRESQLTRSLYTKRPPLKTMKTIDAVLNGFGYQIGVVAK